jgi:hypothetical protein
MAEYATLLTEKSIHSGKLLQHFNLWSLFGAVSPIQKIILTLQQRKIYFHAKYVCPYNKKVKENNTLQSKK